MAPIEVLALLGAGGMGEVYRARDTKLGRDVAIKILPEVFALDPDRLARFAREAQVLAALNHPNIAAIYGLEEANPSPGSGQAAVTALVMELVEGEDLAQRLARGAIPLDEALPIARQIAEALEAAHELGIIHRDLKPANIKVREDGTVKVLDFGLAKLTEAGAAGGAGQAGRAGGPTPLSQSPTITSPALMTGAGMILGTAAYMAPEQARGKPADKRSDVWAFGCVLYEMLTGTRTFGSDDISDTLAMVLMKEADWSRVPAATPPAVRTLLRRCLEKDRKRRLPDIGVARLELDEALLTPAVQVTGAEKASRWSGRYLVWTVAALASAVAIALGALHFGERRAEPAPLIRFSVLPPPDMTLPNALIQALSPDGRHLVFQVGARVGGPLRLAVKTFDADQAREIPGTLGANDVFWSPDSRFIGFFAEGNLKKIDVNGGPPQMICDALGPAGGTWNSDGTIVFGLNASGLFRVSDGGGTPVPVTTLDAANQEYSHRRPWFLPDGRHFLYVAASTAARFIYIGSLDDSSLVPVVPSDSKAVYADGYLLFVRQSVLLAQPFDPARLVTIGDPVVVAPDIPFNQGNAAAAFSSSTTGLLSFRTASLGESTRLGWVDRGGKPLGNIGETADQTALELSPDGTRLAVSVFDPARSARDVWIYDLARGLRTRFTSNAGEDWLSIWSPDSSRLAFSSARTGLLDLYQQAADGSGTEELLVEGGGNKYAASWSSDGRFIMYSTGTSASRTGNDLWILPTFGDRPTPKPFLQTPFNETSGRFSPDGRWIAYGSNESGNPQVHVTPFPGPGGKWQVSTEGGSTPRWRRDGRELFYLAGGNTLMAAAVDGRGTAFQVGVVRRLFEGRFRTENYRNHGVGTGYDVSADGQRFLVNTVTDQQTAPPAIAVVTNWTAGLKE